MPKIALIVAMRSEVPQILRETTGVYRAGNNCIGLAVSGVGLRNARRAARQVCNGSLGFQPDILINSGFCGAVQDGLDIGHLVLADRLAHRELEIKSRIRVDKAKSGFSAGLECHVGKLQTFGWPVLSRTRVHGDALAVDMEAFGVAQTAAKYRIPLLIIKAVSDIVPEQISMNGLLNLARKLKANTRRARTALSSILKKLSEGQDWIELALKPEAEG